MNRNTILRHLRRYGCYLKREGGAHSLWINPRNGSAKSRRRRIGNHSLRGIRKRGRHSFLLEEEVIFGSDYPLLPVKRYLKEMEDANLPEDWREMILGKNLSRLFRLS